MSNGDVMIWNVASLLPERVLEGHNGAIRGLAFTSNGSRLVSASLDGALIEWDVLSGANVWRQTASHGIQHLTIEPKGDTIWASTRAGVVERRNALGELTGSVKASQDWAMAAAVSAVHQTLFVVNGEGAVLGVELHALNVLVSREAHGARGLAAELSPDEQVLATASEDGVVLLWRSPTLEPLAQLVHHKGAVRALRFSPDGRYLASAGDDRSIRLWDLSRLLTPAADVLAAVTSGTAIPSRPLASEPGVVPYRASEDGVAP
jgi:WD40 repeat protein